jgi:ATP-dependent DNA helicase MPH1
MHDGQHAGFLPEGKWRVALKHDNLEVTKSRVCLFTSIYVLPSTQSRVRAMDDSDDYGDLDDTAFLDAATQYDAVDTPAVLSPRPLKRRKIAETASISSRKLQSGRRQRGPFVDSDDDTSNGSDEVFDPAPAGGRSNGRRSETVSNDETSASSTKQRKVSQAKGKENVEEEYGSPWKKTTVSTKRDRIHVPTTNLEMEDVYFTQPPPENSPPWKTRGAIWQKPALSIGVHRPSGPQSSKFTGLDAMKTIALAGRQSISSRPVPRPSISLEEPSFPIEIGVDVDDNMSPILPQANNRINVYDPTDELADLPSDAFASSSSSPLNQDGEVNVLSERRARLIAPQTGLRQTTLFGRDGIAKEVPPSQINKRYSFIADQKEEPPTHHKLDPEAIKTWVYPTNLGTTRDYQFNIVHRGLFNNLLVALPTGLGKTFIAATIMLNWFRWTTEAQIVFVAPTKPLVSQQVEACFKIAGIPRSATTMLTGGVSTGLRAEEWAEKRVFFMTPQTLINDLKSGIADAKKIVLVVVDEAHRATGSYAYVEIVSFMRRFNPCFRVLALTATPGDKVESVQAVIDGLVISKIEIRTENSMDISHYVHHRTVEKKVFANSDEMEMCMELYSKALQPLVSQLASQNAFWSKDPLQLTPFGCMQSLQKWFQEAGRTANQGLKSMVSAIFKILASISHGMELLKYHGIRPFHQKMKEFKDSQAQSKSKYKKQICDNKDFKELMVRLDTWVNNENFLGHPKLEYLQGVILDHFVQAGDGQKIDGAPPSQTRIMIFAHFRDSAEDIVRVLKKQQPMIRPHVFVGQASTKTSEAMGQKDQLNVIEKFKSGVYNTLVATSIGEEGLDIGEVDLIVCYDSKASPIRMLQRMGRTGRKRAGKIIMLQMEGKEVEALVKATDNYEKMQEMIAEGSRFKFHDDISRRILPHDVRPAVDKRVVEIPPENSQSTTDWLPEPRKKNGRAPKRPPKKFHMPDGAITGFVTAGRMDQEIAPKPRAKKKVAPPATVLPSEELAVAPDLGSVMLNDKEMHELYTRFQHLPDNDYDDDEGPTVEGLNLSRHAARQRTLSRTKYLSGPGRVRQRFVNTMQRMHAMDDDRLDELRGNLRYSDCDSDSELVSIIVPDDAVDLGSLLPSDDEMWADDDPPPSQPLPKAKPAPKPRTKAPAKPKPPPVDKPTKAKPIPKRKEKPPPKEQPVPKGKPPPKPRSRPRKDPSATTPSRQPNSKAEENWTTPRTPAYRMSALANEAASSSPPPTDPHMRLGSQADTIGSDDTIGLNEVQDTQAYRLDSDLVSFIADDDEDVDVPTSSLPMLGEGFGRGTQAVVKGGRPKRPKKAVKIFSSDVTDDEQVVSSDSDDDGPLVTKASAGKSDPVAFIIESETEEEEEPLMRPVKRARRVVEDDEDDE